VGAVGGGSFFSVCCDTVRHVGAKRVDGVRLEVYAGRRAVWPATWWVSSLRDWCGLWSA
jgi:hypothetical protein